MFMTSRLTMLGLIALVLGTCFAQTGKKMSSLCSLQEKTAPGEHLNVLVSGVYIHRLENSELDDPACPFTPYQGTWVEIELRSKHNQKKLNHFLEKSGRASVVFEGEFYGSPIPDPKLSDAIQKQFPPHWGHLGCCRTKLVVHVIREVMDAPPEKP